MTDRNNAPNDLPEGAEELDMSSTFIKWKDVGDKVQGTILRLESSKKYKGENFVLVMLDDNGKRFAVSAPLKLVGAVQDHDLKGERVVIMYVGATKTANGEVKEFKVWRLKPHDENRDNLPF